MNEELLIDRQLYMENVYSKQNIKQTILEAINKNKPIQAKIDQAVDMLIEWQQYDHGYESKNNRIAQIIDVDFRELVESVLVVILPMDRPQELTSVVGQLTDILHYSDRIEGIKTVAEIVSVIGMTDLYEIYKDKRDDPMKVLSNYDMGDELYDFIEKTKYLPPMVCRPKLVHKNSDNAYLRQKGSLILGKGNYHEKEIGVDVINKMNQTKLQLDVDLLKLYKELPKKAFTDPERQEQFEQMVQESLETYVEMVTFTNEFYLTHKKDKRGRTYSQGYHITTQGTSFKKAIIELAHEEVIEGVY